MKRIFLIFLILCISFNLYSNEGDFHFGLPSPSEILMDAESEGLAIKINKKNARVLGTDLIKLGQKNKFEAAFAMGRIFSIAGFSFKDLNNKTILKLAQRMYVGTTALKLPKVINDEITGYYQKMLKNPKWERAELMIFFTSARSSLMFLMKDKSKVSENDYPRVLSISTALELGMWFQSIHLALENLPKEKSENFGNVFMDSDIFDYFDSNLKKCLEHKLHPTFFEKLSKIHNLSVKAIEDEKIEMKELEELKIKLSEVIK